MKVQLTEIIRHIKVNNTCNLINEEKIVNLISNERKTAAGHEKLHVNF
jgi:hypothetical protein